MRLGVLIPEFPGQTHIMFWREVTALRAIGHDVQILSTRPDRTGLCSHAFAKGNHGAIYCWPPSLVRVCISMLSRPLTAWRALRFAMRLKESGRLAKRIGLWAAALDLSEAIRRSRLEHVHVHSAADAAHVASMASLVSGVPYSIRLHGDLDAYGGDHYAKFKDAEFVISASRRHIEEAVRRECVREGRYGCVPMGVDMSTVIPRRKSVGTPLRIITVARLNRAKGHEIALNALQRCRDQGLEFRYTIIGGGDYRPAIEQQIDDLGLRDRVVMKGSLDAAAVAECLAEHDVFLLPSTGIGEAAPVSVMEAMAAGLAVVCSAIGDTPDMVRDGVDGFVTRQGDVQGVAEAIQRLHADRELLERCGESARTLAIERFDSAKQAQRLLDWILEGPLTRHG
jgi:colanic acid/amylovoran biosynthesis glycosyltransferase